MSSLVFINVHIPPLLERRADSTRSVQAGQHQVALSARVAAGGADTGPTPYDDGGAVCATQELAARSSFR